MAPKRWYLFARRPSMHDPRYLGEWSGSSADPTRLARRDTRPSMSAIRRGVASGRLLVILSIARSFHAIL